MRAGPLDGFDPRRRRMLRLALIAASFLALVTACTGVLLFRLGHPKDMFQVRLEGLPADAAWWCLAYDDGTEIRLLRNYGCQEFPPVQIFISRAPDGAWRRRTRSFYPDVGVRWRSGMRYAVLWRDKDAHWHRCWIAAAKVTTAPSPDPRMAGVKTLSLTPGSPSDLPGETELSDLGLGERRGQPTRR